MKLQNLIQILIGIACIGLLPKAQALSPAPDGGYPGGNTAEGQSALFSLTSGGFNTAVGFLSLRSNATGQLNTAIGAGTLLANTADGITAIGAGALFSNTTGPGNTATGAFALFSNTTGGGGNTANGFETLFSNTIGIDNTATGYQALFNNAAGSGNTAIGIAALANNTTGSDNIALGVNAGASITVANNVICIGAIGADVSNSCYIGNIFGAGVGGGTTPVFVDSNGKLGTNFSSRRFTEEIKPMEEANEALFALKPVTFHYKNDKTGTPQFGLIAEDVAEINPDLVVRDSNGEIYTVRYDAVNAVLLNEFLKEHRTVQELKSTAAAQESIIMQLKSTLAQQQKDFQATAAHQQKEIEGLTEGLQKVSTKLAAASPSRGGLEMSKFATGRIRRGGPGPQIVLNNP